MKAHRFRGWVNRFSAITPKKAIGYAILGGIAGTGGTYAGGVVGQFIGNYQDYVKGGHLFSVDGAQIKWPNFNFIPSVQYAFASPYGHAGLLLIGGGIVCLTGWLIYRNVAEHRDTDGRGFLQSEKGTYGTSGWMDKQAFEEVLDALPPGRGKGIPLGLRDGQVVQLPDGPKHRLNRNIAVYGTPGCGKTRGFVLNQILYSIRRGESIIMTDTKGELYETTADYLRRCGYTVKLFNLVELNHSDGWDCLGELCGLTDRAAKAAGEPMTEMALENTQTRAQLLVDTIMKNTTSGKVDVFWYNAAANLLKALVLYVYLDEGREDAQKTLGDVYELVCNCSEPMLEAMFNALPPDHPAKMPFSIYQMNAGNDKISGGVRLDLGARLQILQSKSVRRLLGHNDIRLDLPAHEKCAYFIRISDQHDTFQFLSSLMFSFLFTDIIEYADTHGRVCPVPVNFILDEFPNIGEIPDFTKKLSTVRSRRVNIDVIFQSIPQLKNRYQLDQWREILDDCDTSIFLGGNGDMTTEYVAKQTGEISVKVDTEARELNLFRVTDATRQFKKSEGLGRRQLLTTDEVRRLAFDEEIVIIRGQKPLMLDKFDYSLNPDSKKLREIRITDYTPNWPAPRRAVRDFKTTPQPAASDPPPTDKRSTTDPAPSSARPGNPAGASYTPTREVNPTVTEQTKPHRGRRKSAPTPGQQTLLDFSKSKPSPQPPQDGTAVDGFEHKDPSEL